MKDGVPFPIFSIFFCIISCPSSWVLPLVQEGKMVGRLLLSTTSDVPLTVGFLPALKATPAPYLGTYEPFSLDFISLCLCT